MKRTDVVAFLGPSLPAAEAKALLKSVTVLPPAGRGDVWRALAHRPRAIALIDGLFEASPSVWHREILEALAAGVGVFGGASMGALRAVELAPFGMVGLGQVYRWFRDGTLIDDAEVALLHAGATHGHRPLTVPLVNVRWVARQARATRWLAPREARALVAVAGRIFYQDRTWPRILSELGQGWSGRKRFLAKAKLGLPDLKAEDARGVLAAAVEFARRAKARPLTPPRWRPPSALVNGRLQGWSRGPVPPETAERALLAGLARSLGLTVEDRDLGRARVEFARAQRLSPAELDARLVSAAVNSAQALRFFEEVALARLVTEAGPRLLPGVDPARLAGRVDERWRRR